MTRADWQARIARAELLAERQPNSAEALRFYSKVLRAQKQIYLALDRLQPEGPPARTVIEAQLPPLLQEVNLHGTDALGAAAQNLITAGPDAWVRIIDQFHELTDDCDRFLARAFLEPYTEWIAVHHPPAGRHEDPSFCPCCGAAPQVAVLQPEGEGARRGMVCSMCQLQWNYQRILCPRCGETEFEKLPVFSVEQFPHLRVEACDSCKTYLLGIDLGRAPDAVPVVDELGAVALNLSAQESGYEKLHPNLLGL